MANRPSGDNPTDSYYLEKQENLLTELDPNLQKLILDAREQDRRPGAKTCNVHDDHGVLTVDVVAKLHKRTDKVEGLIVGRRIGQIVTGAVALEDIESVRKQVLSLKAATRIRPALAVTVPEIRCDAESLRDAFPGIDPALDGSGVIVGIVDHGCDFRHGNFLNADGTTRLLFLWDQRTVDGTGRILQQTAPTPSSHPYGREFDSTALNRALFEPNPPTPFRTLDYRPDASAHGTHVMDIAAGNGRERQPPGQTPASPGVALGANLIFVHVDTGDVRNSESLGNSRRLLEAVEYIFDKAEKLGQPAVVNISLGTHGGPHDGSTPVEQGFERLLRKPGRAIVIAAGNFFEEQAHTQTTVQPGQPTSLSWLIQSGDLTPNEMEIWYRSDAPLEVSLVFPGNTQRLGPVRRGETHVIRHNGDDRMMGQIIHRESDPNNEDHQIDLLLDPDLPRGIWTVEISSQGAQRELHAWIERDNNGPSIFANNQARSSHTLASICCGTKTIAVGAYDSHNAQPMSFSSSGPTRDGRKKPDLSAPGQHVLAARARGGLTHQPGTSVAAPHVTGLVALLFQAAGPVSNGAIKRALRSSARRNPPAAPGHHLRYGHGRVAGVAALQPLQQILAPAQPQPPDEEAAPEFQINLDGVPVPMVPADLDGSVPADALIP